MPSLGYLIDDPRAIAARTDPRNWSMALLVPTAVPVPDEFDCDLGPVLDQDGVGACVAFAATSVRNSQERVDEGKWVFDTDSAFLAYKWLKQGHGAYPGDGINAEGSYPQAVWQMAKVEGVPGIDGKARKIAAYYQLQGTPGSTDWIDTQIQVLLQFGAVTACSPWPNNWWDCGTSGILPFPAGIAGAHMFVKKGFTLVGPKGSIAIGMSPSGRYWKFRQSWGTASYRRIDKFGRAGEFLIPFEAETAYPNAFGGNGEVWKTIDLDEYPNPEPTPPPTPEELMVVTDRTPMVVDLPIGLQLFKTDGVTPLVKMSAASANVYSPAGGPVATQRFVTITTSGVAQFAVVNTAGLTFRPYPSDTKHKVRVFIDGVQKWEEMV
jgi:hypothetical protein